MKKKYTPVGEYSREGKNVEGPEDEFLEKTAPLIGYIVHRFNTLEDLLNRAICEWICERSDSLGLIVLQKMNYASKVDLLNRLVSERPRVRIHTVLARCSGGHPDSDRRNIRTLRPV